MLLWIYRRFEKAAVYIFRHASPRGGGMRHGALEGARLWGLMPTRPHEQRGTLEAGDAPPPLSTTPPPPKTGVLQQLHQLVLSAMAV